MYKYKGGIYAIRTATKRGENKRGEKRRSPDATRKHNEAEKLRRVARARRKCTWAHVLGFVKGKEK